MSCHGSSETSRCRVPAGKRTIAMLLCLSSLSLKRPGWQLEFSFDLAPPCGRDCGGQKLAAGLLPAGPGAGGPGGMASDAWRSARLSWPVASARASMRAGRVQGLADSRR